MVLLLHNRALDKREYLVIIWENFFINSAQKPLMLKDGSNEGSQHMVSKRNEKLSLSYHQILL